MLQPGDAFPEISLSLVGGGEISVPSDTAGSWVYLLFYRGGW
jgi:peroxiredoxin